MGYLTALPSDICILQAPKDSTETKSAHHLLFQEKGKNPTDLNIKEKRRSDVILNAFREIFHLQQHTYTEKNHMMIHQRQQLRMTNLFATKPKESSQINPFQHQGSGS